MPDQDSFERAFIDLYPRACRTAYRIVGSWAAAEDVAAEALLRTFARWDEVATHPRVDGWVLRVATNLALGQVRRPAAGFPPVETFDPSDVVAARVTLVEAMRKLPVRQREAVALRYFADLKQTEVAAALGISEGSVKTHIHRAVAALRVELGDGVLPAEDKEGKMRVTSLNDALRAMETEEILVGTVTGAVTFGPGGVSWPLTREDRRRGFGFRVDIGVEALMHKRDATLELGFTGDDAGWLVGQEVDVKVVDVDQESGDVFVSRRAVLETERIRALRRALLEELRPGQKRTGKVAVVLPFGAFVDLDGTYGLLPSGEFASPGELDLLETSEGREQWKQTRNDPARARGVARGRGVRVEIVSVDVERERAVLKLAGSNRQSG